MFPIFLPMFIGGRGGGSMPEEKWYWIGVPISFILFLIFMIKVGIPAMSFGYLGGIDIVFAVVISLAASFIWPVIWFVGIVSYIVMFFIK